MLFWLDPYTWTVTSAAPVDNLTGCPQSLGKPFGFSTLLTAPMTSFLPSLEKDELQINQLIWSMPIPWPLELDRIKTVGSTLCWASDLLEVKNAAKN